MKATFMFAMLASAAVLTGGKSKLTDMKSFPAITTNISGQSWTAILSASCKGWQANT
ncbi:MAG: hypothetical protein V8T87_04195 [Victivallales bacterium]